MSGKMESVSNSMLYFAYGSNMSLTQMASRCPSSTFEGKGRLSGYRWQINERGVGNIIESRGNYVEGVVYKIDQDNRRQLDRNEGVGRGYYKAESMPIRFTPLQDHGCKTGYVAGTLETKTVPKPDIEQERSGKTFYQGNEGASNSVVPQGKKSGPCVDPTAGAASESAGEDPARDVYALVYISTDYKTDGKIRTEYIPRMEKATIDAQKLGLSRHFLKQIEDCIRPSHSPPQQLPNTQQSHGGAQNPQGRLEASPLQKGDSNSEQRDGAQEDRSKLPDPTRTARV